MLQNAESFLSRLVLLTSRRTSNILAIPFRKGKHLSLSSTITRYINSNYDQHPDMFKQDLEVIDALRRDAVNVQEAHASGIRKLQAYAAQLVWIGGKFPIDVGSHSTSFTSPNQADICHRLEPNSHGTLR